jgi:hypothetical protein
LMLASCPARIFNKVFAAPESLAGAIQVQAITLEYRRKHATVSHRPLHDHDQRPGGQADRTPEGENK